MPNGHGDDGNWLAVILASIGGAITAAWGGVRWYFSFSERKARAKAKQRLDDAVWLNDHYQDEIKRLLALLDSASDDIDVLRLEHVKCQTELAALKERVHWLEENHRGREKHG